MQEARERVRSAIRNAGFEFPLRRITVNLAPADVRKQGPLYDLPIAVAILVASQQVPDRFEEMALLGELSLDGHLRHVNGVLPLVSMCADLGIATAVVPPEDVAEARLAETVEVRGLGTLAEVREGPETWRVDCAAGPAPPAREQTAELAVIRGQEHVKRALEVAAAGGHNVMLQGPPGAGKTLLARAVPGIMPELSAAEALDVTKIYSVAVHGRTGPWAAPRTSVPRDVAACGVKPGEHRRAGAALRGDELARRPCRSSSSETN